jgi:hypothetical protein
MDWSALQPLVASAAPTIGGLLGGFIPFPGGAILGKMAGTMLAEALGVPPTPEAVHQAITTGDPATVNAALSAADAKMVSEVDKLKAELEDVQDARATTLQYVKAGSRLAFGPVVISVVAMIGFVVISFMAMKPDLAGVDHSVTLYLLGAWQGLATAVVSYWIGSSMGSADKSDQIAAMAGTAAKTAAIAAKKK